MSLRKHFLLSSLLLFVVCSCKTPLQKQYAHYWRTFKRYSIDTLVQETFEVKCKNERIYSLLDSFIIATKQLPEYSEKIKPLYLIAVICDSGKSKLEFSSTNDQSRIDPDVMYIHVLQKKFGVMQYKGYQIIVETAGWRQSSDSSYCFAELYRLFERTNHKILVECSRYYITSKLNPIHSYPTWDYYKRYAIKQDDFLLSEIDHTPPTTWIIR